MDLNLSMQSVKNLFSFPFKDEKWKEKFLIGSGVVFAGFIIPILPWLALMGYAARLIRAGARNEDPAHLPVWQDWGELFIDGLRLFGVSFVLSLPAAIIMSIGWIFYMVMIFSTTASSVSSRGDGSTMILFGMFAAMLTLFICTAAGIVLSLAAGLLFPAAAGRVATQRRFAAFFEVGAWWKTFRANWGGFLICMLMMVMLYFVTMLVAQFLYMTIILCAAIPLVLSPLTFYMLVIFFRLTGHAYADGLRAQGLEPLTVPSEPLAAVESPAPAPAGEKPPSAADTEPPAEE